MRETGRTKRVAMAAVVIMAAGLLARSGGAAPQPTRAAGPQNNVGARDLILATGDPQSNRPVAVPPWVCSRDRSRTVPQPERGPAVAVRAERCGSDVPGAHQSRRRCIRAGERACTGRRAGHAGEHPVRHRGVAAVSGDGGRPRGCVLRGSRVRQGWQRLSGPLGRRDGPADGDRLFHGRTGRSHGQPDSCALESTARRRLPLRKDQRGDDERRAGPPVHESAAELPDVDGVPGTGAELLRRRPVDRVRAVYVLSGPGVAGERGQ